MMSQGSVVLTAHNNLSYDVLGVQMGVGLDDIMPDVKVRVASKAPTPGVPDKEEESQEKLTFRQYFK